MGVYDDILTELKKLNEKFDVMKMLMQQLVEIQAKIKEKPVMEIKASPSDLVANFIRGGG